MNTLALVGDLYGLSGAVLAVFGRIWLSHLLSGRKPLDLPASSDPPNYQASVDKHRSGEHSDILSFILVGSGFAFLLLTDAGEQSSSLIFLFASVPLMIGILGMGFTTYIAIGSTGYKSSRRWMVLGTTKSSMAFIFMWLTFFSLFPPIFAITSDNSIPPASVILEVFIGAGCLAYVGHLVNYKDVNM